MHRTGCKILGIYFKFEHNESMNLIKHKVSLKSAKKKDEDNK